MNKISLIRRLASLVLVAGLSTVVVGCAGGARPEDAGNLAGLVSGDAANAGTVEIRDGSAQRMVVETDANGQFQLDVRRLAPPYVLQAHLDNGKTVYGVAVAPGVVSIDPLTTVAFTAASRSRGDDGDDDDDDDDDGDEDGGGLPEKFAANLAKLRVALAPLFACYGITPDTLPTDPAYRRLFADVRFEIDDGRVVVSNRQTGKRIFVGSLRRLSSGTFTAANLPAHCSNTPPPVACTTFEYSAWGTCRSDNTQTRTVTFAAPVGCNQSAAILTQGCEYVPPSPVACTQITYSAWGACQPNGTQTRTIASSAPAGCDTSAAMLTQACTYVPPGPVACTQITYSAWEACQPNNTQTRTIASSAPAGCDTSAAVLAQACTYVPPGPVACTQITYSAWEACQPNNTQTRTIASSAPAGCDASAAVLTQACTYVPPGPVACTQITYSAWGACQPSNTQTRTITSSAPAGCDVSGAVLSQACTYVAPASLSRVSLNPTSVTGGSPSTGTVTLSAAAPAGGAVVTLTSSSTSATVSASVTVPANATSANFTVSTRSVTTATTATITAAYGGLTRTASLTVNAPPVTVNCTGCHGAPPSTGMHSFHAGRGYDCVSCHGTGFSARSGTTGPTHMSGGTNNVGGAGSSVNTWDGTNCTATCHGSDRW